MAKNKLPVAKAGGPVDMPETMKVSSDDKARQRRYMAEDALRDIERAEAHKKNAALMRDVKSMAKEKMASLKKIC